MHIRTDHTRYPQPRHTQPLRTHSGASIAHFVDAGAAMVAPQHRQGLRTGMPAFAPPALGTARMVASPSHVVTRELERLALSDYASRGLAFGVLGAPSAPDGGELF
jgi:hypothetical protein